MFSFFERLRYEAWLRVALVFVFGICPCATASAEEDAQGLLDRALRQHAAQEIFSGRSLSLATWGELIRPSDEPLAKSRYKPSSAQYLLAHLKIRRPQDYYLLVDTTSVPDRYNGPSLGRQAWWKLGNDAFSGSYQNHNGKFAARPLSPPQFLQEFFPAAATLRSQNLPNLGFAALVSRPQNLSNISWGLVSPRWVDTKEQADGTKLHCIFGTTHEEPQLVWMWIEEPSLRLRRVVVAMGRNSFDERRGPETTVVPLTYGETLYDYDESPLVRDEDFAAPSGFPEDLTEDRHASRFLGVPGLLSIMAPVIEERLPAALQRRAQQDQERQAIELLKRKSEERFTSQTGNLSPAQMGAVVIIEGDKGRGTGFMTKIRDSDFVVTNLHVIGANRTIALKTMTGATLAHSAIYGAIGRDIALFKIPRAEGSLEVASTPGTELQIGTGVLVVGNYNGSGVANHVSGMVKGLGPDLIEVDAQFAPGNSGSPIINRETGKVIAVASYRSEEIDYSRWLSRGRFSRAEPTLSRWFGYRLDGPIKWQLIELPRWQEQIRRTAEFRELSDGIITGITQIKSDSNQHPRVLPLLQDFRTRLGRATSDQMKKDAATEYLQRLRSLGEIAPKSLPADDFYDYFTSCLYWEHSLAAQKKYREAILAALGEYVAQPPVFLSNHVPR